MQQLDINIVYDSMIKKLKQTGNAQIIQELENSNVGAATGSEALMMQASYLLSLRHLRNDIFEILQQEIKNYTAYCEQHGLSPK